MSATQRRPPRPMRKTDRCDAGAKVLGLLRLEAVAHASALIPIPVPGEQHSSPEGPGSCVKVRGIPSARLTQRGNRRYRNKDTARVICRAANFTPGRDLGLDHLPSDAGDSVTFWVQQLRKSSRDCGSAQSPISRSIRLPRHRWTSSRTRALTCVLQRTEECGRGSLKGTVVN